MSYNLYNLSKIIIFLNCKYIISIINDTYDVVLKNIFDNYFLFLFSMKSMLNKRNFRNLKTYVSRYFYINVKEWFVKEVAI